MAGKEAEDQPIRLAGKEEDQPIRLAGKEAEDQPIRV